MWGHGMNAVSSYYHAVARIGPVTACGQYALWGCGRGSRYARIYPAPPDGFRPCPKCAEESA